MTWVEALLVGCTLALLGALRWRKTLPGKLIIASAAIVVAILLAAFGQEFVGDLF